MTTPAWVATDLLDSGKTTLINRLMEHDAGGAGYPGSSSLNPGETPLTEQERVKEAGILQKPVGTGPYSDIARCNHSAILDRHSPDLILVEWNGMEHFHRLEEMLLQFAAKAVLSIEKGGSMPPTAPALRPGSRTRERLRFRRLRGSDCAYVRLRGHGRKRNGHGCHLYSCNPDIRVYTSRDWDRFAPRLCSAFGMRPRHRFAACVGRGPCSYMAVVSAAE
ncbi:MAG: hypothetical protein ACLR0U_12845 [Enterocloster clostridioformis]